MKRVSVLLTAIALSLSVVTPAFADVLFSQSPDEQAKLFSQMASSANGAHQVYDDFTLGTTATVGQVSWSGLAFPADGSDVQGFVISFYSDSGSNTPGAFISSFSVDGGQTDTGTTVGGYGLFTYSAPVTFTALEDTEYWISIVADTPGGIWGWDSSTGKNLNLYQDNGSIIDGQPVLDQFATDAAFTLSSPSTVPEPSTLVFTGTGILALAGMIRRGVGQV